MENQEKDKIYFVSYAHSKGFGNVEVKVEDEMVDIDAVQTLALEIAESLGIENVVILNFFVLRVEERV